MGALRKGKATRVIDHSGCCISTRDRERRRCSHEHAGGNGCRCDAGASDRGNKTAIQREAGSAAGDCCRFRQARAKKCQA